MNKYKKGQYGYLNGYKFSKLIWTLVFAAMIASIVLGTLYMFGDTSRVMIVFAILAALPFAKFLIAYIICASFKPLSKEKHAKLLEKTNDMPELFFDFPISMYEGVRFYQAVCVKNGNIIAYVEDSNYEERKKDYEKWLLDCLDSSKYKYIVQIYTNFDKYIKKINSIDEPNDKNKVIDKHVLDVIKGYCL